ncbi:hypothetical protein F7725_019913 [Dissostichus mawsoni]|uniref:Uncharacterized protein n=1 Tax=Dissostichus mawsoni TaxID=36200 RepID=A0A7J5YL39_DISMA|nr:hypothetical protein F7725_019913 [Dissostichus mawsoni]
MWESLGFVIAFAYSTFLCLETKLYILLSVLVLTVFTYPIVEYHERKHPTPSIQEAGHLPHNKKGFHKDQGKIVAQTKL